MALGAWSGVALVTKDSTRRKAALDFGWNLGASLQVIDDCVDLAHAAQIGCHPGWVWNFPVVLAREQRNHASYTRLDTLVELERLTSDQSIEAVQLVTDMGGVALALGVASSYRAAALVELDRFALTNCPELRGFAMGTIHGSHPTS